MLLRFYFDPETQLPHVYTHEISENEVEQILTNPGEIVQEEKALE